MEQSYLVCCIFCAGRWGGVVQDAGQSVLPDRMADRMSGCRVTDCQLVVVDLPPYILAMAKQYCTHPVPWRHSLRGGI